MKKRTLGALVVLALILVSSIPAGATDFSKFDSLYTLTGHSAAVNTVAWSPDGRFLATGGGDYYIYIWDLQTPETPSRVYINTAYSLVEKLVWSPDGTRLAAGVGGLLKIWNANSGNLALSSTEPAGTVHGIDWSPDGTRIATVNSACNLTLWDATTATRIGNVSMGIPQTEVLYCVKWSPNGNYLAAGCSNGKIFLQNGTTGASITTINAHTSAVLGLSWNPSSSLFASSGDDGSMAIWIASTGGWVKTLKPAGTSYQVYTVAWNPDGWHIATGSGDGGIRIYNWSTASIDRVMWPNNLWMRSVDWNPDGSRLASGGYDNVVRIYGELVPNCSMVNVVAERSEVTMGQVLNLTAKVRNTGNGMAVDEPVKFYDNATLLGTKTIWILKASTNTTIFRWLINASTATGYHTLRAVVGSTEAFVMVNVKGIPVTEMAFVKPDRPLISCRESVNITATVMNNGSAAANQLQVNFTLDDLSVASKFINVPVGGQANATYRWETSLDTPLGLHTFRAVSNQSSRTCTVTVVGIPIVVANSLTLDRATVINGQSINMTANVANDGNAQTTGTQVSFFDEDKFLGNVTVSLAPGEDKNVTYGWQTDRTTPRGVHLLKAVCGETEASASATVAGFAELSITGFTADSDSVTQGETANITVIACNSGTLDAPSVSVELWDGSALVEISIINIEAGKGNSTVFRYITSSATPRGNHELFAMIGSQIRSLNLTVLGSPDVRLFNFSASRTVAVFGASVELTATLENIGGATSPPVDVKFYDGAVLLGTKSVPVGAGLTEQVNFTWRILYGDYAGIHTIRAVFGATEKTIGISVTGGPIISVKSVSADRTTVYSLSKVTIAATVVNNGTDDAPGVTVNFFDGGELRHTATVDIPRGKSVKVAYTWTVPANSVSSKHTFRAEAGGSSRTVTVNVGDEGTVSLRDNTAVYSIAGGVGFAVLILAFLSRRGKRPDPATKK